MASFLAEPSIWYKVAALSGASAVAIGAYASHGFKPKDPYYLEVMRRANHYHLLHSLLLAVAPSTKRPWLVGGLTLTGISLFSGACYAVALQESKAWAKLAPMGGMTLIAAWLSLAL
ncbi:hypothetical protein HYH03_016901 [Edaphochlamys debaryana]|uniref:Transmembrane protein 256 homolog n=1 Tax=Edaphochlamys debaryana TaxID=47281 RepID=A0A836BPE6_9CHLO|nr:hypothetical protein HYH03_016901 [Edaphochlamys debaryana]|eukprot:KAG2484256.1 hypothetical protein HYH03_016901 [Edaphochlamys debaryana]